MCTDCSAGGIGCAAVLSAATPSSRLLLNCPRATVPVRRVTIQFDNRGSKVMDAGTEKKIIAALAKHVFMVPASNVVRATGMGQSR